MIFCYNPHNELVLVQWNDPTEENVQEVAAYRLEHNDVVQYIYFFAELSPADESTWYDPNFMKTDPQCRAVTHRGTICPNNSTPSDDLFCRVHILHPPMHYFDSHGNSIENPRFPGRK
jgi:hypothetical protein